MPSRRSFLIGGAAVVGVGAVGAVLVETDVLPGRRRVHDALGLDGPEGTIPDVEPGPYASGTLDSAFGGPAAWGVSYPPGSSEGDALPVVLCLHGRGDDHHSCFDDLGLDRFLAAQVAAGGAPFVVAAIDGGETYWHRRADGEDRGAMVADEFLPLLAERGLDADRVGLMGWSMGGYGSLLLAGSGAVPARAVATMSAALWASDSGVSDGAFDGADDFERHDVFGMRDRLADIPLRVDCGDLDPFADANEDFRSRFDPEPAGGIGAGVHDMGYWRHLAPEHLRFVGERVTG